ncbi:MAG: hypothetical protein D6797_03825 [Bdellovibrio sp.]|nr:MAG: hypothetical protein D6797_03825 [Bdellovibrio sp.]
MQRGQFILKQSFLIFFTLALVGSVFSIGWGQPKSPPFPLLSPPKAPFWRVKPKVYQKILENRSIVVSVKTQPLKGGLHQLYMQGAGIVSAPLKYCFAQARQFENLKKVSSYIVSARFHSKSQRLYLHTKAYGFHAQMLMQIYVAPSAFIHWKVVAGSFTGLRGVFVFKSVGAEKTELSLTAIYPYKTLKMPHFFVEFGLEVILQKVAWKMRRFIEERYKQSLRK